MRYSIGEVADITGLSVSTLRYYDREGFFPNLGRSDGGPRLFSEAEVEAIRVIGCLKTSGMPIRDIKRFLEWCQEGDASLQKRRDLFHERLEVVTGQMEELQRTMDTIRFKCWYYDTALAAGSEAGLRELPLEELPEEVQGYKRASLEYA